MTHDRSFTRRTAAVITRSSDATRLGLLFTPLVLQIALLRLLETTMLRRGALVPVETLLWTSAPLPLLNLLVGFVAYWIIRGRMPDVPAVAPTTLATTIAALTSVVSYLLAPWWIVEWVTPAAFEVLRWDVMIVLVLLSTIALILAIGGPRIRAVTCSATHLIVPLIMTLSAVGFGYFLATGSPADWHIFKYAISHFSGVRELVAGSMEAHHVALTALPWIWSATVWRIIGAGSRTRRDHARSKPSASLAFAPVMLVLGLTPASDVASSVQSGSLHRIVQMAAADVAGGGRSLRDVGPTGNPDFDAIHLRFDRSDSTRTPNLVVILLESVRHRSTTPYNPDLRTMPFLDSLASVGTLVEDMTAVVSYTNKSLVPLYAGIYPRPGRDLVEATPHSIPATGLPALLASLGYRSAFFTPATMEFERKDVILGNLGFDHIAGADELETTGFHRKAYFGFEDRAAFRPALDWARRTSDTGHPFFLNFLTLTSHHPYDVPEDFSTADYGVQNPELNAYYNALRYTDDFLKSFTKEMTAAGLSENTVFIILGDHGEAFREHMENTHGNVVWEEALRVPAVLYGPGLIPAGRTIVGARQHIDLLPTIADLLNVSIEGGHLPGKSLLNDVPHDRTLYHHSLDDGRVLALRRDSLKFMYFYKQAPSRVYNYIADPLERHDLSDSFSPEDLSAMELELLLWRKRVTQAYRERRRGRVYPKTPADSTHVAARSVSRP